MNVVVVYWNFCKGFSFWGFFFGICKQIAFKFALLRVFQKYEQVKFVLKFMNVVLVSWNGYESFRLRAIVLDVIMFSLGFSALRLCLECLWGFLFRGFSWCASELRSNLRFFRFLRNMNRSKLCPSSWVLCLYLKKIMNGFCLGVIVLDLIVCLLRFLGFAWLKMNAHQTNHRAQKAWNWKAIQLYLTTYMLDMRWFATKKSDNNICLSVSVCSIFTVVGGNGASWNQWDKLRRQWNVKKMEWLQRLWSLSYLHRISWVFKIHFRGF